MKKYIVSILFIGAFGSYVLYTRTSNTNSVVAATTLPSTLDVSTNKTRNYIDGTYTGTVADAYYGNIQVEVAIKNSTIADITFLQYPRDRRTSIEINTQAMPILKTEAIKAQRANVNIVSGATDTSKAFTQSLNSALSKAKM